MANNIFSLLLESILTGIPLIHGGHDGDSGLLGLVDKLLESLVSGLTGEWTLFPGIKDLGLNIHPMLVHFPIALLSLFVIVDTLGALLGKSHWRKLATSLVGLGAISSVPTLLAGLYAAHTTPHGALVHQIMEHHEHAGMAVVGLSSTLALWRRFAGIPRDSMGKAFSGLLTLLLTVALVLGADLGAAMVYGHGVAVKTTPMSTEQTSHLHGGPATPSKGP